MTAHRLLTSLIRYKATADDELIAALERVDAAGEGGSAAFRAALRVFSHAHIVDRIFAAHLGGTRHPFTASWSDEPPPLSALAAGVRETDRWYVDFIDRVAPDDLAVEIPFTFTDGARGRMTREEMLAHVVTHGGYHRGEVGRLLPAIEETAMRDVFTGFLHRTEPGRRGETASL
ncbi:DinB family protein [Segnochrobactrum spirostomi]|uniref:Damage-inducible protein DinB n=1 Tax=Segnochrobactrum spirostomi TaxID=2608987 RepID=A0A6A7Y0Y2_9HYPH|nr:DinB family protein [Segnochrobactrum spirostomi]MQT11589.1 damage-inducible protein DinB [Segnochrobactrum spirostomi]